MTVPMTLAESFVRAGGTLGWAEWVEADDETRALFVVAYAAVRKEHADMTALAIEEIRAEIRANSQAGAALGALEELS